MFWKVLSIKIAKLLNVFIIKTKTDEMEKRKKNKKKADFFIFYHQPHTEKRRNFLITVRASMCVNEDFRIENGNEIGLL